MKWHVGITVLVVLAILVLSQVVKNDREEVAANKTFKEAVRAGNEAYNEACGKCHETYDPRFYVYDEWSRLLQGQGCPKVPVELSETQVSSLRDFLRAKGAPSDDEAETTRSRQRARFLSESVRRGEVLFKERCSSCHARAHDHPYFVKVRTAAGWREVIYDLGSFHPGVDEPVWVDSGGEETDILAFLASRAAGTPSDAKAITKLLASGTGSGDVEVEPEVHSEIQWVRNHEKGLLEALKKKLPVVVDVTDLSGG